MIKLRFLITYAMLKAQYKEVTSLHHEVGDASLQGILMERKLGDYMIWKHMTSSRVEMLCSMKGYFLSEKAMLKVKICKKFWLRAAWAYIQELGMRKTQGRPKRKSNPSL